MLGDVAHSKQADIQAVQQVFTARGYAAQLVLPPSASGTLHWIPNWARAGQKRVAGVDYVFVPLAAELHTGQQVMPVILNNTRRYLRAQRLDSVWSLALVDYIRENGAAPAPAAARWLANFTGTRLRHDLDHGQAYLRYYRNGQAVSGDGGAARYTCQDYYTCTWTAVCQDARGNYYINGTTTYGYDYCDSPQQEACGTDQWGRSWYQTGSQSNRVCVNDDGDPVDPNDPGGGGTGEPTTPQSDPCARIKSLTANSNSLYNASLATLRNQVVNPPRGSQGEPLETGITFTDPDNIATYVTTLGSETQISMGVAASSGIGGSMHDHPAGPGTLPLFPPDDLRGIYRYVKHLNDNGQVPTGYTATVVLHTGETYTLVLDDVGSYIGFGMIWFESEYDFFKFQEEYYNGKAGGIGTTGFSTSSNEKAFLTMLNKESNGLKLLKTNTSSPTWAELGLNSGNVVSSPCP